MSNSTLISGNLVTPERVFYGELTLAGARIAAITELGAPRADAPFVLPGFIDEHLHGLGADNVDSLEGIRGMAKFAATKGTTRFCPTASCSPHADMLQFIRNVRTAVEHPEAGAALVAGTHLEGSYLSQRFRGGMVLELIRDPDLDEVKEYLATAAGTLKLVTIAPERPGALEVVKLLRANGVSVNLGHSECPPEFFATAVEAGINGMTHLFDAYDVPVSEMGVRRPAITDLALIDDRVMKELICDGIHVPPELIRLTHRAAGADHIVAITDAMQGAGLPEGRYSDFGRTYIIRADDVARLESDGSIVGSTLTQNRVFFNLTTRFGFTEVEASRCLSANPAKQLNLDGETGELRVGLAADVVVVAPDHLTVLGTYLAGERIYAGE